MARRIGDRPRPSFAFDRAAEETWGVEDPGFWVGERNEWILPTPPTRPVDRWCLWRTKGLRPSGSGQSPPEDKDAAIFPRPLRQPLRNDSSPGFYDSSAHIWLSFSPDMTPGATITSCCTPAAAPGETPIRSALARAAGDCRGLAAALSRRTADAGRMHLSSRPRVAGA